MLTPGPWPRLAFCQIRPAAPDPQTRMPTQLITGHRRALEGAFAQQVSARQASDPLAAVHVLVASTLLRPYLRRVLARDLGGALNVHLLTPGELGLTLGEPNLLRAGRQPLPLLADRVLTARAAVDHPGAFADVAELPGFPGALARTLRDLRLAGAAPDLLARIAAGEPDQTDPDTRRLASLADLHAIAAEARGGRYGPEDALALADPAELETGLIVYGVWEVTALLGGALRRISEAGHALTVLLPRTGPATASAVTRFTTFLTEDLGATTTLAADPEPAGAGALPGAADWLFAPAAAGPVSPDDPSLRISTAPDPPREVAHVVRQLLTWADEGIAFHEMAVAYRDGATYRVLLDAALRDADIPAYVHEGTPLSERPLGRRVLALLGLADARDAAVGAPRLARADVLAFLADARLPEATYDEYGKASVPRWETITRRAGVIAGIESWRTRLGAYGRDLVAPFVAADEEPPAWATGRVADAGELLRFVEDLGVTLGARPHHGTWAEHASWLDALLERYVDDAPPVRGAIADLARLDTLAEPTDAAGFDRAVTALLEGLRDRDVLGGRAGAFGLRGVNVLDVVSLRQLGFRAVAIVGLGERSFPPPPREDPLLLDDRRQQLAAGYGIDLPLRARGGDPEPLQFLTAVEAADERLLATFARAGSDGRGQLPSTFLRALAERLAGRRVTAADVESSPIPGLERLPAGRIGPLDPATALTARERRRALLEDRAPGAVELVRDRLPRTIAGALARDARNRTTLTAYDGLLSAGTLPALRGLPSLARFSATGLEAYAACPQQHFLSSVLGLRPIEEPEELQRLGALDKGTAIHTILQRFLRDRPTGPATLEDERRRLQAVAGPVLDALESDGRTGFALLWEVDRIRIEEDLDRWLVLTTERDAGAPRPTRQGFEVRFGPRHHGSPPAQEDPLSRDEPLLIVLPSGQTLSLGGYVDRVDHSPGTGRFTVVDYKSGSLWGKEEDELQGGQTLQLPLYLLAIADLLGVDPAGGMARYESVDRKGRFERIAFDGALVAGERPPLIDLLDEIVESRRSGDFHREPALGERDNKCNFCSVSGACDPRRKLLHRRKDQATQIAARTARLERFP